MLWVPIVGIFLVILSWFIRNAGHMPVVYRVIAPKYPRAHAAYVKMSDRRFILKKGDHGFDEVAKVALNKLDGQRYLEITQFKTLGTGSSPAPRKASSWLDYIDLEISLADTDPVTLHIDNFKTKIETRFMTGRVFRLSCFVFWSGIALTLLSFALP